LKSAGSSFKEAWKGLVTDAQPGDDNYDFPEIDVEKEMRETYPTSDKYGYNAGTEFAGVRGPTEIPAQAQCRILTKRTKGAKLTSHGLSECRTDMANPRCNTHDSVNPRTIGIGHTTIKFDAEGLLQVRAEPFAGRSRVHEYRGTGHGHSTVTSKNLWL
jgi:hypothetical protein